MRNMENPFKFGTIVEEDYFTDRVEEVAYIEQADYRDGSNEHFFKEIFWDKYTTNLLKTNTTLT